MTLFAIALIAGLSFTIVSLVTMNGRGAQLDASTGSAYYLAAAGISYARAQLASPANQPPAPAWTGGTFNFTYTEPQPPAPPAVAPVYQRGSCQITLVPPAVGGQPELVYVTAFPTYPDGTPTGQSRTMIAFLQVLAGTQGTLGQVSYASYGYNTSVEMAGDYWITGNTFTGPANSNGHFNIWGKPAFNGKTSTANVDESTVTIDQNYPTQPFVQGSLNNPFNPNNMTYDPSKVSGGDNNNGIGIFTSGQSSQFYHAFQGSYNTSQPTNPAGPLDFHGGQPEIVNKNALNVPSMAGNAAPSCQYNGTDAGSGSDGSAGDVFVTFNANGTVTIQQPNSSDPVKRNMPVPPLQPVSLPLPQASPVAAGTAGAFIFVQNANVHVSGTVHGQCTIAAAGYSPEADINYAGSNPPAQTPPDGGQYSGPLDYTSFLHPVGLKPDSSGNYPYSNPATYQSTHGAPDPSIFGAGFPKQLNSSTLTHSGLGDGNIFIAGNINYLSTAANSQDKLGLIAQNNAVIYAPPTTNITVDALLIGENGIFMTDEWYGTYMGSGQHDHPFPTGPQLNNLGGLTSFTQTLNGVFNSGNGTILSGYNENYTYDARLANAPPPGWPTIPGTNGSPGQVNIVGIVDKGAMQ